MRQEQHRRQKSRRSGFLTTSAAATVLVVSVLLAAWTGLLVLRQIDELSRANSDNVQWSLSQAEVEFLRFRIALEETSDDPASLTHVRRSFDIFYSRMTTVERGEVFRSLRDDPAFTDPRSHVQAFLDRTVPIIDGPDAALLAAIPDIATEAADVNRDIREFSLAGLTAFAEISDGRRGAVIDLLARLAAVLAVLFLGLTITAVTLFRLFRLARSRGDQIQRAGARMRTIVEASPNAIIVADSIGTIREFNPAAEAVLGYPRVDALGRNAVEMLLPAGMSNADHARFDFLFQDRRPKLDERRFEITACDRDARHFPAQILVDRAEADEPIFVFYIRDLSEERDAARELTEARDRALAGERAKSEFLAVMSHEMRTPLNGLLGSMQLLNDHQLTERQSDLLTRMRNSGAMLLGLVNDVLDLAKFEAGKMKADSAPFSIARLMDGVIETAAPMAQENGNAIEWRWVGAPHDNVSGDMRRLRQVMLNLVANAIKFTRNGHVDIEVERLGTDDDLFEIRVIDTGIGIDEDGLARIFNDFETLDSSYAREAGGTGLGLGISRRFLRLMGGEIGVESEYGAGSLFWIRLPLSIAEDADVNGRRRGKGRVDETLEILLVEDNEMNRFVARSMLENRGHKVTEAANGQIGVDLAQDNRFDVILMDISMPVLDGVEATRHIRGGTGASADTPIIALTAHALPEERDQFFEAGMAAFLSKPIDRDTLCATIEAVLTGGNAPLPKPRPTQAPALVDQTVLSEFVENIGAANLAGLTSRFLAQIGADIEALGKDDLTQEGGIRTAHRCAGSAGTLGLSALRAALVEVERKLKTDGKDAGIDTAALTTIWHDSRAALEAQLKRAA